MKVLYALLLAIVACSRFDDTCSAKGDGRIPLLSFSVGHDRFTSGNDQQLEVTAGEVIKVCVRSGALDDDGEGMEVTVTVDGDPMDFKVPSRVVTVKTCEHIVEVLTISREKDSSFEITATSDDAEGFVNASIVIKATALEELLTTKLELVEFKIDGITEQMSKKFQQLNATCSQRDLVPRCDHDDVITACNGYNDSLQTICTSLGMSDCTDVTAKVSGLKNSVCNFAEKDADCSLSSAPGLISTQLDKLHTVTVALQNNKDQLKKLCAHICNNTADNNLLNDKNLTTECKCTLGTEPPTNSTPPTSKPSEDPAANIDVTTPAQDPDSEGEGGDPASNKTLIIGVVGFIVFVIALVAVYALYHNRSKVTACLDASPPKAGGGGGGKRSGRNRRYQKLPQTMEAALHAE